jgi:hypothetical protein
MADETVPGTIGVHHQMADERVSGTIGVHYQRRMKQCQAPSAFTTKGG